MSMNKIHPERPQRPWFKKPSPSVTRKTEKKATHFMRNEKFVKGFFTKRNKKAKRKTSTNQARVLEEKKSCTKRRLGALKSER